MLAKRALGDRTVTVHGRESVEMVEIRLDDGGSIFAEVKVSGGGDVAARRDGFAFEEARQAISQLGSWAVNSVRSALPEQPDVLELEFGMKLAIKTGKLIGVLAEASGESSLLVRMSWGRPAPRSQE